MQDLGFRFTMSPQFDAGAMNVVLGQMKKSLGELGKDIKLIDEKEFDKELSAVKKSFKETFDDTASGTKKTNDGLNDIAKSARKASDSASMFNKAFQFNQVVQATYLVSSAVNEITASSIQYESSLAAVGAITGFTGDKLTALGENARQLALTFGGSATDQLKSFQGVLSKLGPQIANDSEALALFGKNINLLSAASGDDAATSMNAITDAMLQMGLASGTPMEQAQKSTEVINALAAGAQVGAAEIPQVGQALVACGVAAKGANMDIVGVNAAIQVMAVGGKTGAEAGTALRNVLGLLQKASAPAEAAMKKMGTSSKELGDMLTTQGLDVALTKLQAGMNGLGSDAEKNAALMEIFGTENASAAGILMQNLDKYQEFSEGIRAGMEGTGSAFEQANMRMSTAEGSISRAKAAIEDAMISLGSTLGTAFTTIASTASSIAPLVMTFAGLGQVLPFDAIKQFGMTMLTSLSPALVTTSAETGALVLNTNALTLSNMKSVVSEKANAAAKWLKNSATKANLTSSMAENAQSMKSSIASAREATSKTFSTVVTYAKAKASAVAASAEGLFSMATLRSVAGTVASTASIIGLTIAKGAMAVATGVVTAATWLWNVALMANPIVAIGVGIAAAVGAVYLLADAFSYSAEEREADLQKENQALNIQMQNNKKQQDRVKTNQSLIDSYEALGKKSVRTAEEEAKFKDVQIEIAKAYPGIVSGSNSFAQNLDLLKSKSKENTAELKKYQEEMKALQSKKIEITVGIKQAQGKQLEESMDDMFSSWKGGDVAAQRIVDDFQLKMKNAKDAAELDKIGTEFKMAVFSDPKMSVLSGEEKQQLVKLTDDYQKNLSDTMKAKEAQATDTIKNSLDAAMAKGTELSPDTLVKISKQTGVPIEKVEKMYADIKEKAANSKVNEAIQDSFKISGNLGDADLAKSLADEYQKAIDRINELKSKKDTKGLTASEQAEFDALGKKAEETANKIGAIAPQSKTNFRTVVDEAGNLKQVFDINIAKVNEFGDAQKNSLNNTEAQTKYNQAMNMNIVSIDKQKDKLDELKTKIDATNDPTEKQKLIAEYNNENTAINKNKEDLLDAMVRGANAGLSAETSIVNLSKALGISSEEAKKMLLSKALQDASKNGELTKEKVEGIATKFNTSKESALLLWEAQKKNTAEAGNTANAAKDIVAQYDEAYKKSESDLSSTIAKINALQTESLTRQLTEQENAELAKLKMWAKSGQKELQEKNKVRAINAKLYDASAKDEKKTSEKSAEDTGKKLADITRENQKLISKIKNTSLEDDFVRSLEEKKISLKDNEQKVQDEIDGYKKKKKLSESEKKEQVALEDQLLLIRQANSLELLDFESKNTKERLEKQEKAQEDSAKRTIDNKKIELEALKKVQNDSGNEDEIRKSIQSQGELEREIITGEAKKQIADLYANNDEYKKVKEEKIKIDSKLLIKQRDLEALVASNAEQSVVDSARVELAKYQSDLINTQSQIEKIESDINANDVVKNITVELSTKLGDVDSKEYEKLEELRINAITDLSERTRQLTIKEAEKTYQEELKLSQGNTQKKLAAEYKFLEAKKQAEQKYLSESSVYYGAVTGLVDSFKSIEIKTVDKANIKKLQSEKDSISKEKQAIKEKYNQNMIEYEEYSSELESIKQREADKDTEIATANAERQKAIWSGFTTAISGYFTKMYEDYSKKSEESVNKVLNTEAIASKASKESAIADSNAKMALFTGNTTMYAAWSAIKQEATNKELQANEAVKASYGELWANMAMSGASSMAQMLVDGENFWKAILLTTLKALKGLIPVLSAQILGYNLATPDSVATMTATGWAKYALTMAGLYGIVGIAEAAVQGAFFTGVTRFRGKGTGTSDSNLIKISDQESVVTAKATNAPHNADMITYINKTGRSAVDYFKEKGIFEPGMKEFKDYTVEKRLIEEFRIEKYLSGKIYDEIKTTNAILVEEFSRMEKSLNNAKLIETRQTYDVKMTNNIIQSTEKIDIARY